MKTRTRITVILLTAAALMASCATGKPEKAEAKPEVLPAVVVETVDKYGGSKPEAAAVEVLLPVPVIPSQDAPMPEKEAQEVAEQVAEQVAEEVAEEVAAEVEEILTEQPAPAAEELPAEIQPAVEEKPAEDVPAGILTKVFPTDSGDIILSTKGSQTTFLFPMGTERTAMENVAVKMMDIYPQTAFTLSSSLNMQAPETFVRDNSEEIGFILEGLFAKTEEELPVKTEPEVLPEMPAEQQEEVKAAEPEKAPVDSLPAPENLNVPEKDKGAVTNAAEKAKGIVTSAAAKTGLSENAFMFIIGGLLLLVLIVVLVIRIARRKKDEDRS